jgi:uncharacterized membrane protein (UPF0127 family)
MRRGSTTVALLAALALLGVTPPGHPLPVIDVAAPKAALRLEVAQTDNEREYGLMNRTVVQPHTGMLFVFDQDGPIAFWMKDTLIPLDMVFAGADGTVRKVFANVKVVSPSLPDAQIPLEQGSAKFVIELAAGEAKQDGITPGIKLNLSHIPPVAADQGGT